LVHWDAGVPTPASCYALLELSGRLSEVELVAKVPLASVPQSLGRPSDFPPPQVRAAQAAAAKAAAATAEGAAGAPTQDVALASAGGAALT